MKADKRREVITQLCAENGGRWGDGTIAHSMEIDVASHRPADYDIDIDDLDGACEGDVASIFRLRVAWGLLPF